MGGAIFVVLALTPYGGWHKEAKEWTDRVAHPGDKVPHDAWGERFEHPARTWGRHLRGYLPCVIDLTGYPGSGDETETESDGGDGA